MSARLRFRMFAHSWISDWNHGNAHFLRGLAQELVNLGHEVRCYEEKDAWSRINLRTEGPDTEASAIQRFHQSFPQLDVRTYDATDEFANFADEELRGADILLLHEWNRPEIVNNILGLKKKFGFRALFHDTHHRAYTSPQDILKFKLHDFDGVLAFGEPLRRIYVEAFGVSNAWTFHEAADANRFRCIPSPKTTDVVWVGNWGDEERTRELEEFLIGPAESLKPKFTIYGVRYPACAQQRLAAAGIEYRGYLPNLEAPQVYAQSRITLHVPRRFYANGLSGVPTIRVFETLACGIPLLCAPWADTDGLFTEGEDYLCVEDGRAMEAEMRRLLADADAREQLGSHGRRTIERKHTCAHRAHELLNICEELGK